MPLGSSTYFSGLLEAEHIGENFCNLLLCNRINLAKSSLQSLFINGPNLIKSNISFLFLKCGFNSTGIIPNRRRHRRYYDSIEIAVHLIGRNNQARA